MANRVIDAILRLTDNFTVPASKSLKAMASMSKAGVKVGKDIKKAGDNISNFGTGVTAAVTAPLVGVAATSVKTAASFESAMSQVAASMGKTVADIPDIAEEAKRLGRETSFSAVQAAEGFNILAQAGLETQDQIAAMPSVLNLAAAGSIDMAASASYVTGAVMGFGDSMENASKYADMIAVGATQVKTDVSSLGEAFSGAASIASSFGQSSDTTAVTLMRLAQANITGSEAANSMRRVMTRLYAPTDQASDALAALGVSAYDQAGNARDLTEVLNDLQSSLGSYSDAEKNAYLNTILGQQGLSAYSAIMSTTGDAVTDLYSAIEGSGGAATTQAKTQLDNLNGSITILKSAIEGAQITLGEKLLPYIKQGVEHFQAFMDKINGLSDAQVDNIVRWGAMAAAVGPAIMIFGKVVSTIGKGVMIFNKFGLAVKAAGGLMGLVASPVGLVIGAIAALVAIVLLVRQHMDQFKGSLGALSPVFESIKGHVQSIIARFEAMCPTLEAVGSVVANVLGVVVTGIVGGLVGYISSAIDTILSVIEGVMTTLQGIIDFITGVFTGNWALAWQGVQEIFSGIFDSIMAIAKGAINGIISAINGVIGGLNTMKVPDWVPEIGGMGVNIPLIPQLARGTGNWTGGLVQVHELGGEIIDLPQGSRVYPHDKSVAMARAEGAASGSQSLTIAKLADQIIVREDADIDRIANALADRIKKAKEKRGGWSYSANMV